MLKAVLLLALIGYLAVAALAHLFADRMIFLPPRSSYAPGKLPIILLPTESGGSIATLHLPHDSATFTLLFSHGNAEDLGHVAPRVPLLPFDRFPNLRRIGHVRAPVLVVHGEQDEVIDVAHGRRLYGAAPAPKHHLWVAGAGHNDLVHVAGEAYWRALREFVNRLEEPVVPPLRHLASHSAPNHRSPGPARQRLPRLPDFHSSWRSRPMADLDKAVATQLANIEKRTGKSLAELTAIVRESGLAKHGELVAMLKSTYGMGHGDANLLVHTARKDIPAESAAMVPSADQALDGIYAGAKAALRPIHERLKAEIDRWGDFGEAPKKSYVSYRRAKQFATIGPATNTKVEVGLNARGLTTTDRLQALPSGQMCNYRVRVGAVQEVDAELIAWIRAAYEAAG